MRRPSLSQAAVVLFVLSLTILFAPGRAAGGAGALLRLPAAERIVAMADWHGDLEAARRALRLAGAIDDQDRWIGGDLVVVQTGDQLDRGDQERAILDLLERLGRQAAAAGGAVHVLLGNHEIMNIAGDFRYVTEGGWTEFADLAVDDRYDSAPADSMLAALKPHQRARAVAFRPGGPYARRLAEHPVALIVGRNLFVHGGVLPEHAAYGLARLNRETRLWLLAEGAKPSLLSQRDSPLWTRCYCRNVDDDACVTLGKVLESLDCDRMFVGHTIQANGIAAYCDDRVWCMDTGAADYYAGPIQVLEITPDAIRILDREVVEILE